MRLLRRDGMAGRWGGIALKGKKPADSEDTSSIGRSLDAKGRCRRAVINVTRRNSGRICTTGAGFAQADQTYNVSPNAKEKSPVPHLIRKYLQRRRGFLMRISNLI